MCTNDVNAIADACAHSINIKLSAPRVVLRMDERFGKEDQSSSKKKKTYTQEHICTLNKLLCAFSRMFAVSDGGGGVFIIR